MSFGGGGGGSGSVSTDDDVLLNNPVDGQVLTYNGSSSKWENLDVYSKVLLIDNAASLPAGTPAGVIVVVKS